MVPEGRRLNKRTSEQAKEDGKNATPRPSGKGVVEGSRGLQSVQPTGSLTGRGRYSQTALGNRGLPSVRSPPEVPNFPARGRTSIAQLWRKEGSRNPRGWEGWQR